MKKFFDYYYFHTNILSEHRVPLKEAKYNKYLYGYNKIAFKSLILCGLYNINDYNITYSY